MKEPYKILLAEDETKLAETIRKEMQQHDYHVEIAADGEKASELFAKNVFDLVLLDISLPKKNGMQLCEEFRKKNKNIPIIMLTALGELDDKMVAFSKGADDYIVKPFHFSELLARMKVFLKRASQNIDETEQIQVADLVINFDTKNITRGGKTIELTAKEFALLELLARNKGRITSKPEIAEKVWDIHFDTGTNTIEVYINFLRNKIDKPFGNKLIHTKAGFGYFLKDLS